MLASAAAVLIGLAVGAFFWRPGVGAVLAAAGAVAMLPTGEMSAVPVLLLGADMFLAGRLLGTWAGLATLAVTAGAALAPAGSDSVVPMAFIVVTPFLAGRAIREREVLARRLADRAAELEREREVYAQLAVRYERARIASELHDIVAHAMSVMVVQAGAGQRLAAVDPALTAEAFSAIGDAARQAEADLGRLVTLLARDDEELVDTADLDLVEELVARAAGTGLDVTLRLEGRRTGLPAATAKAAYAVVREGLTNALRYASGAPVRVVVDGRGDALVVEVVNAAAPSSSELAGHGTGNGLRGLRERVGACGGRLEAGVTDDGGWRLQALLPRLAPVA